MRLSTNKIIVVFSISIGVNSICDAQNLVPNPSFEDTIYCPYGAGQIDAAANWENYGGTPECYNLCAPSHPYPAVSMGIPSNFFGFQYAFDGNAYSGMATYDESLSPNEYIGIQLSQPLAPKQKYYVSCYIVRAGAYPWDRYNGSGASNNFGFRFSMQPYSINIPCPTDNFSHYHDTTLVIDSVNWTKISGSFVADTSYEYLTLGNFYDQSHTDTLDIIDGDTIHTNFAYYFVDYVCVSTDSLCSTVSTSDNLIDYNKIKIYPNPFNDVLNISVFELLDYEFILFNQLGQIIKKQNFNQSCKINVEDLLSGIYSYAINVKGKVVKRGIAIK